MNVIDISLTSSCNVPVELYHNDQFLQVVETNSGTVRINADLCDNKNKFTINNTSTVEITIDSLAMYSLGSNNLKYLGVIKNADMQYNGHIISGGSVWELTYTYPVFTWLHKTLHFGWLLEPNKE